MQLVSDQLFPIWLQWDSDQSQQEKYKKVAKMWSDCSDDTRLFKNVDKIERRAIEGKIGT